MSVVRSPRMSRMRRWVRIAAHLTPRERAMSLALQSPLAVLPRRR
ncbi:hypothetical protein [Segniliparus rugosus]|uniref:Uncharacterized protein n=1 Tax=Segniliparus rugosus (strain ATCC BAA-974 / DSM 45345 / CCUG 50838 / CIP 108380 / JCM 13579 / CDC 945) TaxID=679197 RepID=U1M1Z8_SEGRC|nr:hypothetical protein [Segniliparus rugosus]ERG69392.1 hypothetical protein HMPREF9336_04088 [Segniliparus rugosus ATCC BAA-974]